LTIVTFTEKDFDLMSGTYSAIAMEVIRKFARLLSLRIRQTSSRLAALM
jgi:CRP-like cAMP-binding protein